MTSNKKEQAMYNLVDEKQKEKEQAMYNLANEINKQKEEEKKKRETMDLEDLMLNFTISKKFKRPVRRTKKPELKPVKQLFKNKKDPTKTNLERQKEDRRKSINKSRKKLEITNIQKGGNYKTCKHCNKQLRISKISKILC